jgi:hypothetical protein
MNGCYDYSEHEEQGSADVTSSAVLPARTVLIGQQIVKQSILSNSGGINCGINFGGTFSD